MAGWDRIYKEKGTSYDYYDIVGTPHESMPKVAAFLKKSKARRVLDLGCGAGRNLIYLAGRGFEAYGVDKAPEGIKIARRALSERGLRAGLKVADMFERLPYPDGFFDAVVAVQVLQHGTEARIRKAIAELGRVLKPGGVLFATLSGRVANGKTRYCLVKTARRVAPNTFVPRKGSEAGVTHFIYSRERIKKHYRDFRITNIWRDSKGYYCFLGVMKS